MPPSQPQEDNRPPRQEDYGPSTTPVSYDAPSARGNEDEPPRLLAGSSDINHFYPELSEIDRLFIESRDLERSQVRWSSRPTPDGVHENIKGGQRQEERGENRTGASQATTPPALPNRRTSIAHSRQSFDEGNLARQPSTGPGTSLVPNLTGRDSRLDPVLASGYEAHRPYDADVPIHGDPGLTRRDSRLNQVASHFNYTQNRPSFDDGNMAHMQNTDPARLTGDPRRDYPRRNRVASPTTRTHNHPSFSFDEAYGSQYQSPAHAGAAGLHATPSQVFSPFGGASDEASVGNRNVRHEGDAWRSTNDPAVLWAIIDSLTESEGKAKQMLEQMPSLLSMTCRVCNAPTSQICEGCHKVGYCSVEHQAKDWFIHGRECGFSPKQIEASTDVVASRSEVPVSTNKAKTEAKEEKEESSESDWTDEGSDEEKKVTVKDK
ncbi:hypothetical protein SCHPADRAFT_349264 [Schizopora paradoxa]|uniref:MYND-type domain-containing protein n=1 Tax=Schizopora paradoxa TaxID=27342 RepID=A0A0H2RPZ8_9AGAM|nr:hypothetical protein SCHPADRAFT_349264 [Schizopora paradoxa]